jgi:hypothetical protein
MGEPIPSRRAARDAEESTCPEDRKGLRLTPLRQSTPLDARDRAFLFVRKQTYLRTKDGKQTEFLQDNLWTPGGTLHVHFLDGREEWWQEVARVASEWSESANLDFEFHMDRTYDPPDGDLPPRTAWTTGSDGKFQEHPDHPHIRIGFDPDDGNWSLIGRTALGKALRDRTMNLGEVARNWDITSARARIRGTIRHEFGHALGLEHEHRNPARSFSWNEEKVIADMKASQGWCEATIRHNVLDPLKDLENADYSIYDPDSVMVYEIAEGWTDVPGFSQSEKNEISETDKDGIALMYPGRRRVGKETTTGNRWQGKFGPVDPRTKIALAQGRGTLVVADPPSIEVGSMHRGEWHGEVKVSYPDGTYYFADYWMGRMTGFSRREVEGGVYFGYYDEEDRFHGPGKLVLHPGEPGRRKAWDGKWTHGRKQGPFAVEVPRKGATSASEYTKYLAFFEDDAEKALLASPLTGGATWQGHFTRRGSPTGKGTWIHGDWKYIGTMREGVRDGTGHLEGPGPYVYAGEFRGGRFHGSGMLRVGSHEEEGQFRHGKLHGEGERRYEDGSTESGHFVSGRLHGKGQEKLADGSVYEGEFARGRRHGRGTLTAAGDGATVSGEWVNGLPVGEVDMTLDAGGSEVRYQGPLRDGIPHGEGKVTHELFRYQGGFEKGLFHGRGTLETIGASTYVGDFAQGMRQGKGKETYADGEVYEGAFHEGLRHGRGRYDFESGQTYFGDFVRGEIHGRGTFRWPGGQVYQGDFVKELRHGQGKTIHPDGSVHEGRWERGRREGPGTWRDRTGRRIQGTWKEGELEGPGTMSLPDGTRLKGSWLHGKLDGEVRREFPGGTHQREKWRDGRRVRLVPTPFAAIPASADFPVEYFGPLDSRGRPHGSGVLVVPYGGTTNRKMDIFPANDPRWSTGGGGDQGLGWNRAEGMFEHGKRSGAFQLSYVAPSDAVEAVEYRADALVRGIPVQVKNGKWSGTYTGPHLADGTPVGMGRMVRTDGAVFEGIWLGGLPNGAGRLQPEKGRAITGRWLHGRPAPRRPDLVTKEGSYSGDMLGGRPHGTGTMVYPDGDRYHGPWEDGVPHTSGTHRGSLEREDSRGYRIDGTWTKGELVSGRVTYREKYSGWKAWKALATESGLSLVSCRYDGALSDEVPHGDGVRDCKARNAKDEARLLRAKGRFAKGELRTGNILLLDSSGASGRTLAQVSVEGGTRAGELKEPQEPAGRRRRRPRPGRRRPRQWDTTPEPPPPQGLIYKVLDCCRQEFMMLQQKQDEAGMKALLDRVAREGK